MHEFLLKMRQQSKSYKAREKVFNEFSDFIFPYGESQQRKVTRLLIELFPKEREKFVLLYYILLKDAYMTLQDFDQAYQIVKKKKIISENRKTKSVSQVLIEIDCGIDGDLNYPSANELCNSALGR
ncbi:hypothetical protein [Enterococcus sp. N249-2]